MSRRVWRPAAIVLAVVSVLTVPLPGAIDPVPDPWAELEEAVRERGLDPLEVEIPGRLSEEMRRWAHSKVSVSASESEIMSRLLWALVDPFDLGLVYDASHTGTAREVWSSRKANCLGFTHLFVGLSRELGIATYYVRWSRLRNFRKEGDLVLVSEHVSAGLGNGAQRRVLEFGAVEGFEGYLARPISDLEAMARHYSNLSAEHLLAGQLEDALAVATLATRLEPTLPEGWVNLGVALRRSGRLSEAAKAYKTATEVDPDHFPAYQNLGVLMQLQGKEHIAKQILALLDRRDNRNPYIFLSLGDLSLEDGRLDEAERYYRRAIRLGPRSAEIKAARGILALESGDLRGASKWLKRARAIDPLDSRTEQLASRLSQQRISNE